MEQILISATTSAEAATSILSRAQRDAGRHADANVSRSKRTGGRRARLEWLDLVAPPDGGGGRRLETHLESQLEGVDLDSLTSVERRLLARYRAAQPPPRRRRPAPPPPVQPALRLLPLPRPLRPALAPPPRRRRRRAARDAGGGELRGALPAVGPLVHHPLLRPLLPLRRRRTPARAERLGGAQVGGAGGGRPEARHQGGRRGRPGASPESPSESPASNIPTADKARCRSATSTPP